MLSKIFSFVSTASTLAKYVGDFLKKKDIRDRQREIDELRNTVKVLRNTITNQKRKCKDEKNKLIIEYELKIGEIEDRNISPEDVNKKGREISG